MGRFHSGGDGGVGELAKLKKLSLFGNKLSGPVSPALARLINLNYLDLEENNLRPLPHPDCPSLECKTQVRHARGEGSLRTDS